MSNRKPNKSKCEFSTRLLLQQRFLARLIYNVCREKPVIQEPQIVETPLVRAMNQATAEGFQQMHRIVSEDLASMPLESLLNLNHVVPRRLGNLQTDEVRTKLNKKLLIF